MKTMRFKFFLCNQNVIFV